MAGIGLNDNYTFLTIPPIWSDGFLYKIRHDLIQQNR